MIPGLQQAQFARFGVMHRNTFINSPGFLNADFSAISRPTLFFAGQMTGVEGYVESIASGLLAGTAAAMAAMGIGPEERSSVMPGAVTISGALCRYISNPAVRHFQPMNANFGLLPPLAVNIRAKEEKYQALADRSLSSIQSIIDAWCRLLKKTGS